MLNNITLQLLTTYHITIRNYYTFASLEKDVSGPICANTNGSNTFTIADSPKYLYTSGSFFNLSTLIFINSIDFSTTVFNNDKVLSRDLSLLHTLRSKSQFLSWLLLRIGNLKLEIVLKLLKSYSCYL